jgi:hypothetical protein
VSKVKIVLILSVIESSMIHSCIPSCAVYIKGQAVPVSECCGEVISLLVLLEIQSLVLRCLADRGVYLNFSTWFMKNLSIV